MLRLYSRARALTLKSFNKMLPKVNGVQPKPSCEGRLVVDIVDEVAASDPSRPFIYTPRTNKPEDGWEPISYGELANAVNHVARLIAATVKRDSLEDFPTIAYVGPSDVRYPVVMLASIKAGCKALFISPRNSLEAQVSLFQRTDCKHIWYAESFTANVESWIEGQSMKGTVVPPAKEWLNAQAELFPYSRTFEEARWEPLVVLHTSGSTGIPKPIVVKQGSPAIADRLRTLPKYEGAEFAFREIAERASRSFVPMPLFHAAGIIGFLTIECLYYGLPLALSMPDKPLTLDLALDCIQYAGVDAGLMPPSLVEELAKREDRWDALKNLKYLTFGGGNLSRAAGDKLTKYGLILNNVISSTELVPYIVYFQHNMDVWHYFVFNTEVMGIDWRCADEKERIYEMVIRRKDPNDPGDQACFYTFPDLQEWSTGDLYQAHPSLHDHWLYYGRADNIIVFSNGEKLNPVTIEETISGHPAIKGAVVCGQDRFQPALILDPVTPPKDEAEKEALINKVWPLIEEVNKVTVAHGQILRPFVMISESTIPFLLTPKGTVQRGMTVKAYKEQIDALYEHAENANTEEAAPLDLSSKDALTHSILGILDTRVGIKGAQANTDFFSLGVDSLQVISISNILRSSFTEAGLTADRDALAPRVVFANPTAESLAGYLYSLTVDGGEVQKDELTRELETFNNLVSKYTQDFPSPRKDKPEPLDEGQTVLLTGTTGSLGAYLLEGLCTNPKISKVIALNRGDDGGKSRQNSISSSRGLGTDFSKVEFLGADLSLPDLGLGSAKYNELLSTADRVVHNAWPVNFNISVASFEPYIRGVRHLVDFSNLAAKQVLVVFLSSIGTAMNWKSNDPVPEARLDDFALAEMGYGRSKLAGSLILDAAAKQSAIPTATVRVGQIAGPKSRMGMWNKQEFFPSLIASSVHLGILPKEIGSGEVVDWVPIEDVAGLILDVSGISAKTPVADINGYFHCVNPSKTTWQDLLDVVQTVYRGRINKLVSFEEWVAALEKSSGEAIDSVKNPGVKLLDTYKGMLQGSQAGLSHVDFSMERTVGHSPTSARLGPVTPELMKNWCEQWEY